MFRTSNRKERGIACHKKESKRNPGKGKVTIRLSKRKAIDGIAQRRSVWNGWQIERLITA
jgi:hypothetical protein